MKKTRSQHTLIGRNKNPFYWLIGERTKLKRGHNCNAGLYTAYFGSHFESGSVRLPRGMKLGKVHSQSSNLGKILKKKSKKNDCLQSRVSYIIVETVRGFQAPRRLFSCPWKSSDLVFQVADREFHVHRAVLIFSFPVFESMLS